MRTMRHARRRSAPSSPPPADNGPPPTARLLTRRSPREEGLPHEAKPREAPPCRVVRAGLETAGTQVLPLVAVAPSDGHEDFPVEHQLLQIRLHVEEVRRRPVLPARSNANHAVDPVAHLRARLEACLPLPGPLEPPGDEVAGTFGVARAGEGQEPLLLGRDLVGVAIGRLLPEPLDELAKEIRREVRERHGEVGTSGAEVVVALLLP